MFKNITTNLMVENVTTLVEFYQKMLELEVLASVPEEGPTLQFAILSNDTLTLMVQEKNNLAKEYPILATEKIQPSISLYITVTDFDTLYQQIEEIYPIYTKVHRTFYGAKEFAIADPDGYVLTFAEYQEG
ncbi:VOC family protein [Enterococcus sp. DIV0800]|uniref:VOC family protein n=1 Tax=unclassified Enterococcus TaxID=2608891 RepID=UPI003D2FF2F2